MTHFYFQIGGRLLKFQDLNRKYLRKSSLVCERCELHHLASWDYIVISKEEYQ